MASNNKNNSDKIDDGDCDSEIGSVKKLLEKLQKYSAMDKLIKKDEKKILKVLQKLESCNMTVEILKKTKVGLQVNQLKKKTDNTAIKTQAKSVVERWMKIFDASTAKRKEDKKAGKSSSGVAKTQPPPSPSTPSPPLLPPSPATPTLPSPPSAPSANLEKKPTKSPVSSSAVAAAAALNPSSSSQLSSQSSSSESTLVRSSSSSSKRLKIDDGHFHTDDPVRVSTRNMLFNALRSEGDDESDIQQLAAEIESCIFDEMKDTGTKYKNRIRSRTFNIKDPKNPQLKEKILNGLITPQRLAVMTSTEMASDELKNLRENFTKKAIHEAQAPSIAAAKSDLFRCSKCGKRDTTYNQVQTLSGDEPMTTFVVCNQCGNRWRFS
ncbi:hypothetical protein HELRODRAFT_98648 [Helobdella robusta]|uniref:Transcription elongation factor n=1 Tax=Helobdella robusta TaxID=6412 RepID=T1G9P2_HELRO|nr:hypothetical protein HELRODRAFT_98648 [Helobdella robusta]ESO07297.1 hypothetical protein HELRODRAFT_98648 [Helobdella robusta]